MFYTTLPTCDTGYVMLDIYKKDCITFLTSRLLLLKIDINDVYDRIVRPDTYILRKLIPKTGPQGKIYISLNPKTIVELRTFVGIRFVEKCYVKVGIYTGNKKLLLRSFQETLYTQDCEQIKCSGITDGYVTLYPSDFYVYLEIPYPYNFSLFPAYKFRSIDGSK